MTAGRHDVVLRQVTFAYGPYAEPVLRELDLTVPEGDHLAVVGPSGIGKSTLAGLLCGLLRPSSGTVSIGDERAADLAADKLAAIRALIPQEAYVFTGSVWDNLTYLCCTATAVQVDNAVVAVGAEALISRLGGLTAELTPAELSAGERQLIALVRAYLSPAPLVVLDEATCYLDPAAERRAEEAFAARGGSVIVIAHRVSSALRAHRILVLDGVSAVVGDHQTLLTASPLYRELLGYWQDLPGIDESVAAGAARTTAVRESAAVPARDEPAQPRQPLICGRITDSGSAPLVGVTLTLTDLAGRQLDRDRTDAGGHYRLRPPFGGNYLVVCASAAHQPTAALVAVADVPVRHDLALSGRGATLSGVVCAAGTGQPLADVMVTLIDTHGDVAGVVSSAADGRFTFFEVAGGPYTLAAAATALQPVAQSVVVPDGGQVSCDVELTTRGRLTGVVRAATAGTAVPEALATLIAADGHVVASAVTGADGGFVFSDLTAGVYALIASGYPPVAAEVRLDAGMPTEMVITMRPPGVIRHRCGGAGARHDGQPVEHGTA